MNDDRVLDQLPDPINLEVGIRLRNARRSQSLSQEDFGLRVKLTAHEVQRLERGLDRVSAVMLVRAAAALGVSPASLLPAAPPTSGPQSVEEEVSDGEDHHALELMAAFHQIGSKHLKDAVVDLACRLADASRLDADEFPTSKGDAAPSSCLRD